MRQPISIQVFIYRMSGGVREYLLFKRVNRVDLGLTSFWQGITGGVEQEEGIKEAALREIYEESSLNISDLSDPIYSYSFPMKKEWKHKYPQGTEEINEYVFITQSDSDPILSDEHSEFGWYKYSEAIDLLAFAESKKALSCVDEFLANAALS